MISARRRRDLIRHDRRLDRLILDRSRMTHPAELAALAREVLVVQRHAAVAQAGPTLEAGDLRCG